MPDFPPPDSASPWPIAGSGPATGPPLSLPPPSGVFQPPSPPGGFTPPPGYVAYGSPGAYHAPAQRIGGIAKWLIWSQIAGIVASVGVLVVQLLVRNDARRFIDSSLDDFSGVGAVLVATLIAAAISIAGVVLLMIWCFRLAKNHQLYGRVPQTWKPGWGVGVWFLQGCTLGILPYLMLIELWKASDPDVAPGAQTWKSGRTGSIVHAWFWTSIAAAVVGLGVGLNSAFGGFDVGGNSDDLADRIANQSTVLAVSQLMGIATSVLFVLLIKQLTERHKRLISES